MDTRPLVTDGARIGSMLRSRWPALAIGALAGLVVALIVGFAMKPAYRVSVVLTIVRDADRADLSSAFGSQLSGIASLAGISLPASSDRGEAVSLLRSRTLIRTFIERNRLLPVLTTETAGWLDPSPEPLSLERGVRLMQDSVVAVGEDRRTGVIEFSVTWTDREVAARWANSLVTLANALMRERAIAAAETRRQYLMRELAKTDVVELRQSIYRLIESQIRAAMMASTREDFAFKVVDPGVPPDARDKVRPKRALLALLGMLVGAAAGAALVALRPPRPSS